MKRILALLFALTLTYFGAPAAFSDDSGPEAVGLYPYAFGASYITGGAEEIFAGAQIDADTCAAVLAGGSAVCTASEDMPSDVRAGAFGFLAYANSNSITIEKGTVVESGQATFLVMTGAHGQELTAVIDGAAIANGGVLIQVMDNDRVAFGSDGASVPLHTENAGFDNGIATAESEVQSFTFTGGSYSGNIYNASGSGGLEANALEVTFGSGASYSGAVASTSSIHVTSDGALKIGENGGLAFDDWKEACAFADAYQNACFPLDDPESLGMVANFVNDNAANAIDVTLRDGAVWQATGSSLIQSLTVLGDSHAVVPEGVTLTVNGTDYTACTLTAGSY